jgi:beta-galactosidase
MSIDIEPTTTARPGAERPAWLPDFTEIAFGGDYNPEQWPRSVWREDVELMREAGVNLVSIGIFSWVLLEPSEGEFDFGWLDEVIELLWSNGISVDLGTPTAAPPAWFWKKHPEALPVTRDGMRLGYGARGMASPSSPAYAKACERIVTALAQRYGRHPALRMWHVHNEYGAPISESYDDASVTAFRGWLQAKYGTLDELNTVWGTAFWGQRYGAWDEIDAPRRAASVVNPAQRLDFARFSNDALLRCFTRERDIIRRFSPDLPVTTNFMATNCPSVDLWKWADAVDVVANDHYLAAERTDNHILLAMDADLTRSIARGRPWMLMEHSTSAVNWQDRNLAKKPGELARNSLSHFGRGADGILFFQWRASRSGAEKFHSAMLPHGGTASRSWRELAQLGTDLARHADVLGSTVHADVAILWDWESFWAQDLEWRPTVDLRHRAQIEKWYTALWNLGVRVDFAHPSADLSRYRLVLAPALYLVSDESAANIADYVRRGGRLVVGPFSGIVDADDRVPADGYGGQLREALGLRVAEFLPLREHEGVLLSDGTVGSVWADDLALDGAEAIATFLDGPAAGGAAITRNRLGDGEAWYVSPVLDVDQIQAKLADIAAEAEVLPPVAYPVGFERLIRRAADGVRFAVYLNHTGDEVLVAEDRAADGGEIRIPAGGARVVTLATA